MRSTQYYDANAESLSEYYNSLAVDSIHRSWLQSNLPENPGIACDIGAGSGRDANWLAQRGWDVVAVEPSGEMRQLAQKLTHPNVTWLDDALPNLSKLRLLGHRFDLVLLSAVWMHVPPSKRERAFRTISELLNPSGVLVITLRHGGDEVENIERDFHHVTADELLEFARKRALSVTRQSTEPDQQRRHIRWQTLVFTMPDDGTGSLPLLRHIIVNDDKSSSYKLGLLRVLTRIAEGCPGAVIERTDQHVDIPLGLVGLFWLKQYKPLLLNHRIPQHPNTRQGYGFAGEDFFKLERVSSYDLRVGAHFSNEFAPIITGAIRDACQNIVKMPANYIAYPGQNRPVFECERKSVRKKDAPMTLSLEFLQQFGLFRIPVQVWETMSHYACWLEPTILREWSGLTRGWGISDYRHTDLSMFDWEEGKRDTSIAASRASALSAEGARVVCVWSAAKVRAPQIDHCFPWSRWLNNDLWNLMPATAAVNMSKGDKLPSAIAMADAHDRITDWWGRAYVDTPLRERFLLEAGSSLPKLVPGEPELSDLYEAMLHQRARLKADQQLVEWTLR
jgi:SAM-dependent methyltransferase